MCVERIGEVAGTGEGSLGEEASDRYVEKNASSGDGTGKSSSSEDSNGFVGRSEA